jgi:uncharacterized protein YwqG
MKNSINLVLMILAFIVLGCTCSTTSNSGFKENDSNNSKKNESKSEEKSDNKSESKENQKDSNENKKDSNENKSESNDDDDVFADLEKKIEESKKNSNNSKNNNSKDDNDSLNDSNENYGQIPTMNQFNKIKPGMSYDEVVDIVGFEGKLIKTDRYLWGDDNSFIMISFQNDKVMLATQNGLK